MEDKKEEINWQERALKLEDELIKAKLLKAYAKDVVENWSKVSLKTIPAMTKQISDLKEALEFVV